MRLTEIVNDDEKEHGQVLKRTGFWGARGAGCLFFARDARQFLLGRRSAQVEQPGTWGTFGGAIDRGEDVRFAAVREAHEETGYTGPHLLHPLYVFTAGSFQYSNFLLEVPNLFQPQLNWENADARWCKFGDWPQPLHFGMVALLADAASSAFLSACAAR